MSLSVGITIKEITEQIIPKLQTDLKSITGAYGYGISFGIESSVPDVREGITALAHSWNTSFFAFLHAPKDSKDAEAGQIGTALEPGGNRENFFKFLQALQELLKHFTKEFSILFAVEWKANDKVRLREGTLNDLLRYLSHPCGWAQELYIPIRDSFWCDDGSPLIFIIRYNDA
jgi:hypothetical protein